MSMPGMRRWPAGLSSPLLGPLLPPSPLSSSSSSSSSSHRLSPAGARVRVARSGGRRGGGAGQEGSAPGRTGGSAKHRPLGCSSAPTCGVDVAPLNAVFVPQLPAWHLHTARLVGVIGGRARRADRAAGVCRLLGLAPMLQQGQACGTQARWWHSEQAGKQAGHQASNAGRPEGGPHHVALPVGAQEQQVGVGVLKGAVLRRGQRAGRVQAVSWGQGHEHPPLRPHWEWPAGGPGSPRLHSCCTRHAPASLSAHQWRLRGEVHRGPSGQQLLGNVCHGRVVAAGGPVPRIHQHVVEHLVGALLQRAAQQWSGGAEWGQGLTQRQQNGGTRV